MAMMRRPGGRDPGDFQEAEPRGNPILRQAPPGPELGIGPGRPGGGPGMGGNGPTEGGGTAGGNGMAAYGPRDNFPPTASGGVGNQPTPPRPMSPTPAPSGTSTIQPFQPLPSPAPQGLTGMGGPGMAGGAGLFGSRGGLQGGGLGVPNLGFGGTANDSISGILDLLRKMNQGQG